MKLYSALDSAPEFIGQANVPGLSSANQIPIQIVLQEDTESDGKPQLLVSLSSDGLQRMQKKITRVGPQVYQMGYLGITSTA